MIVAVDTGGTRTRIARFDTQGHIEQFFTFPTPKNVEEYIDRVANQIYLLTQDESMNILSIALPGIVRNGIALWCPNVYWNDIPICELFRNIFPKTRVIAANDANMAGLASMQRLGTTPPCGLYITLGTGVGTSLILNGQLHAALSDCEGGHMMISYDNKQVSWESVASARVFRSLFGELSNDSSPEVWLEIARRVAAGLQPLVAFAQPDTVVIGGSIGPFLSHFADTLSGLLAEQLPSMIAVPKLVTAPYSEEIVLYGCYDNAQKHITAA